MRAVDPPTSATTSLQRDGVTLHVTTAGPPDGPPVVLLHGWPDSAEVWRHQVPALVAAGHRVLAPDLRGFGRSSRPEAVEAYRLRESIADVLALLDAEEIEEADVVAHDWGATVGWLLAAHVPERVRSLTVVAVGHPRANRASGMAQMEKSFYMWLFLHEGVAETWLSEDGWRRTREWIGPHPETDRWIADLSRPGALTASLGWYRANLPPEAWVREPTAGPVEVPVLGVIGGQDRMLGVPQMAMSAEHVTGGWRFELFDGSTHWPMLDEPDRFSALLLDWLRR